MPEGSESLLDFIPAPFRPLIKMQLAGLRVEFDIEAGAVLVTKGGQQKQIKFEEIEQLING